MKLVTYFHDDDIDIGAIVEGDRVVSLGGLAVDMIDLIEQWDDLEANARALVAAATPEDTLALDTVDLLAPIPRPGKIMAIGLNYADHIAESGAEPPKHQIWFTKTGNSVNGPFDPVEIPKVSTFVDYEAELVAIIGAGGRHIAKDDALAAVFGYCVGDDVSERAWQMRTPQWILGKSFDTHAPFGPWITTADEIEDPHALGIRSFVNGEIRQNSNTSNLVFKLWDQIEELSKVMTLEAGDVIFTGTPGGVGMGMSPPYRLKEGDVVRIEIDGLGAIENAFVAEA